ncbi:MAG: hypothetical protein ABSA81_09265 [Candidatus Bathyarchaeia archaeon]
MNSLVRRRSQPPRVYTLGELNRLIDAFIHPIAKRHPEILILDGIIHSVIERNPSESAVKFIHHNLPILLWELARNQKRSGQDTAG